MEITVFNHIENRFYFIKTKDFMFQGLISEHIQRPASKCAIPKKRGEGGLRTYLFEKT